MAAANQDHLTAVVVFGGVSAIRAHESYRGSVQAPRITAVIAELRDKLATDQFEAAWQSSEHLSANELVGRGRRFVAAFG